jgi:hypothetical protein
MYVSNISQYKGASIWNVTLFSLLIVNQLFGGTYRLHVQGGIMRVKFQRGSKW